MDEKQKCIYCEQFMERTLVYSHGKWWTCHKCDNDECKQLLSQLKSKDEYNGNK